MIKRSILLIALLGWSAFSVAEPLKPSLKSEYAILMNAESGKILYEKNAYQSLYPASTTKMATALFALEKKSGAMEQMITAESEAIASISTQNKRKNAYKHPSYWLETGATHIGIKKGEELLFKDLLYATLVSSANDAANVLAQFVGAGSIDQFMKELNIYLQSIGCKNTKLLNPHGLHHPEHKSTPYDMAIIAKHALKNPLFKDVVATKSYVIDKSNKQPSRTIVQTNLLLKKSPYTYNKAIGIKTGYTSDAGYNLVAAAKNDQRTLIAVLMNAEEKKELYEDIVMLFETAFNESKITKTILKKGAQEAVYPVLGGKTKLQAELFDDLNYAYFPSEEESVYVKIDWYGSYSLPIVAKSEVGIAKLYSKNNELLESRPIYALKRVDPTFMHKMKLFYKEFINRSLWFKGAVLSLLILSVGVSLWMITRRKNA